MADTAARDPPYALHARALIDFLYCGGNLREDDIIAEDFLVPEVDWKSVRQPIAPCLRDMRERSNKLLAHLTRGRLKEAGVWPEVEIFDAIQRTLRTFVAHAPSDRLCETWQEL